MSNTAKLAARTKAHDAIHLKAKGLRLHAAYAEGVEAFCYFRENKHILERLRRDGVTNLENEEIALDIPAFLDNLNAFAA